VTEAGTKLPRVGSGERSLERGIEAGGQKARAHAKWSCRSRTNQTTSTERVLESVLRGMGDVLIHLTRFPSEATDQKSKKKKKNETPLKVFRCPGFHLRHDPPGK